MILLSNERNYSNIGTKEKRASWKETRADPSIWCRSIHETSSCCWPIPKGIWGYRYDAKRLVLYIKCFKNSYFNHCTCTTNSNDLLFIFYSPLWSSKTSFREAYNHNESGSRYIISKEKRTQQSIETGTYWKVC